MDSGYSLKRQIKNKLEKGSDLWMSLQMVCSDEYTTIYIEMSDDEWNELDLTEKLGLLDENDKVRMERNRQAKKKETYILR